MLLYACLLLHVLTVGGVQFLESVFQSPDALVNIERLDEAVVVGAALRYRISNIFWSLFSVYSDCY
jgi:hypothetical protein